MSGEALFKIKAHLHHTVQYEEGHVPEMCPACVAYAELKHEYANMRQGVQTAKDAIAVLTKGTNP